jgi:hypothetical protein
MIANLKSNSQSFQDIFAILTCKRNTFIEVGAARPKLVNNTFLLDQLNWRGFSIELSKKFSDNWAESINAGERTTIFYHGDALEFDYIKALHDNNLPNRIGYLSCDIDPAINTFNALVKIIDQGIEFDCITFEHDAYREKEDFSLKSKDFLCSKGYKIAVYNVTDHLNNHYETWFVKNDIEFDCCDFTTFKSKFIGI